MTTAGRAMRVTDLMWWGAFLLCILWVAGVPKINGWVALAPIWFPVAVSLTVMLVRWLTTLRLPRFHRYPRTLKEKGLV